MYIYKRRRKKNQQQIKLREDENKARKLQSKCRRGKFSILLVDHCSVIRKNNTCVHSLCARSPAQRTRTALSIDICFHFTTLATIILMCLFCVCICFKRSSLQKDALWRQRRNACASSIDRLAKTFGTFHLWA